VLSEQRIADQLPCVCLEDVEVINERLKGKETNKNKSQSVRGHNKFVLLCNFAFLPAGVEQLR